MSQGYSSLSQESNLLEDEHLHFVYREAGTDLINQIANDPTTFQISNSQNNTYSSSLSLSSSKSQSQARKRRPVDVSQQSSQQIEESQVAKRAKSMRTIKIEQLDLTEATAASIAIDKVGATIANAMMAAMPIDCDDTSEDNSIARMAQIGYQNQMEESHKRQQLLKMQKLRFNQNFSFSSQQQPQQPQQPQQQQQKTKPQKMQLKQLQKSQSFQSSPSATEIKHHPTSATYEGPYNFSFRINEKCPKNYWLYSKMLNKVFIHTGKTLSVQFRWTPPIQKSNSEKMYVRAMMVYSQAQDANDIVARCIPHAQPDDALNVGYPEHAHSHLIRCTSGNSTYHGSVKSKEHLSVLTALGLPQKGVDFVELFYLFTCKNSCSFGINRKPTKIIFTLENQQGTVCGRCSLDVRICSVPKRDLEKEESDLCHQQRRNAASIDQNSSGLANGASFNVSGGNVTANGIVNVYQNGNGYFNGNGNSSTGAMSSGYNRRNSRSSTASSLGYPMCDSSTVEATPTMSSSKRHRTSSLSLPPKMPPSSYQSNPSNFDFESGDLIQMPPILIDGREKLIKCLEFTYDIHAGDVVRGTTSFQKRTNILKNIDRYLNELKSRR